IYKWQFPEGSVIPGNGYMIVWADDDGSQGDNHAGFKLTASGEQVWLTAANGEVMDQITFGEQVSDQGFARVPNGTGPFVIQEPTFNANNNTVAVVEEIGNTIHFAAFPNPVRDQVTLTTDAPVQVVVYDALARRVWEGRVVGRTAIDASSWGAGSYTVRHDAGAIKLLVTH
ncbi:MAG: T9SS type A sorting domain-containing protein, partial [Flavobacteriales bacterium]|nr:T9SS type A sorting domain-containing protein [Flavobacteriales bacterium]